MSTSPLLKPVGERPRCLHCLRELRPNFKRELRPFSVPTGEMVRVRTPRSYGRSVPKYEEIADSRPLTDAEHKQWRKEHPPQFKVTYGGYGDNRFCGLTCGYKWAVHHSEQLRPRS